MVQIILSRESLEKISTWVGDTASWGLVIVKGWWSSIMTTLSKLNCTDAMQYRAIGFKYRTTQMNVYNFELRMIHQGG